MLFWIRQMWIKVIVDNVIKAVNVFALTEEFSAQMSGKRNICGLNVAVKGTVCFRQYFLDCQEAYETSSFHIFPVVE